MTWVIIAIIILIIYVIAKAITPDAPTNTYNRPKRDVSRKTYDKKFSVGDRAVNQVELGKYLETRVGGLIDIRYQSPRVGSSRYWRSMKLIKYDGTYLYIDDDKSHNRPVRYRRDRVVEFR